FPRAIARVRLASQAAEPSVNLLMNAHAAIALFKSLSRGSSFPSKLRLPPSQSFGMAMSRSSAILRKSRLDVIPVVDAVMAKRMAESPELLNDVRHGSRFPRCQGAQRRSARSCRIQVSWVRIQRQGRDAIPSRHRSRNHRGSSVRKQKITGFG